MKCEGGIIIPKNAGELLKRLNINVCEKEGNVQLGFSAGVEEITLEPNKAAELAQTMYDLAMRLKAKKGT